MKFNWKYLSGAWIKQGGWLRYGQDNIGLILTCAKPLYSERTRCEKTLKLPFGWRIRFLPKTTSF